MNDIRTYAAYPQDLDICASLRAVADHFRDSGYVDRSNICERSKMTIALSGSRILTTDSFKGLLKLLAQHPRPETVSVHSHWQARGGPIGWLLGGHFRFMLDTLPVPLIASVQSKDLNLIAGVHEKVREAFQASNPVTESPPAVSESKPKKTVFLAHRFDDTGSEMSTKLSLLLRRLGFDVCDGEGYEARAIPEKVAERIRSQDILICLVTAGDSSWLLSEASFAKALGKCIIVLLEDGVPFNKGIIGADYEHLPFPTGNIEKVFIDLLYALPV